MILESVNWHFQQAIIQKGMKRILRSCFCQQAKKKFLQRQLLKFSIQPEGIIKAQRNCYLQQAINIQQEGMEGILRSCYLQQAIDRKE